jgi:hypothetical protein
MLLARVFTAPYALSALLCAELIKLRRAEFSIEILLFIVVPKILIFELSVVLSRFIAVSAVLFNIFKCIETVKDILPLFVPSTIVFAAK